ncbi:MAG: DUF2130 domain-containing protein [Lachnospiraceae bacterium]|nr:DUF2130 domain-containing protein [Lachnospiraceae bacterium]
MQEIKCPNCGEVFQVDESGYAQILSQVRDREFTKELEQREKQFAENKQRELEIIRLEQKHAHDEALAKKDAKLQDAERRILELQGKIQSSEMEKKLAITEAVSAKEKELSERQNEITELKGRLKNQKTESELKESAIKEKYKNELAAKDEQIAFYKDFKARQSTKMVGESLEQHCLTQFNQIRMTAFPSAYFEKDNDIKSGSKGDFIFREADADGTEFISIMFEMKNESDTTASKHKNEDFFKELDKDRKEKNCEYAVLVSLLENDNELYNGGIVDVSYRYEKMYVIRPQFFIPMITLLRNAALNSLKYQQELAFVRNQQLDILHFEENLGEFKDKFGRNYRLASEKFQKAIEEIDKSIAQLEKVKKELLSSENNLRLANDKAEELTIKKLTKNAPSVREMFDELKKSE